MAELTMRKADGSEGGSVTLDDALFGVTPNVPLMHQVVTAQLAAARAGTQSTKTRSEVSGGGAKPFKQKGTGRSRQGTTRAPQWTGGGVALGPKPRSYRQRTPKKMIRAALRSALSDRFAEGRIIVIEGGFGFSEPKTRHAVAMLDALDLEGAFLVVVDREDEAALKAFRNLPYANLLLKDELNAYDVLCNDWIIFTEASLPRAKEGDAAGGGRRRATGAAGIAATTTDLDGGEAKGEAGEAEARPAASEAADDSDDAAGESGGAGSTATGASGIAATTTDVEGEEAGDDAGDSGGDRADGASEGSGS